VISCSTLTLTFSCGCHQQYGKIDRTFSHYLRAAHRCIEQEQILWSPCVCLCTSVCHEHVDERRPNLVGMGKGDPLEVNFVVDQSLNVDPGSLFHFLNITTYCILLYFLASVIQWLVDFSEVQCAGLHPSRTLFSYCWVASRLVQLIS